MLYARDGTPVYGLPERTLIKVRRHEYEAKKAEENDASTKKRVGKPVGVRHDARHNYMANLKNKNEAVETAQKESLKKPPKKGLKTSEENPLVDVTGETQKQPTPKECKVLKTSSGHPLIDVSGAECQPRVVQKRSLVRETSVGNPLIDVNGENSKPKSTQRTPQVMKTSPGNPLVEPPSASSSQSPGESSPAGLPSRASPSQTPPRKPIAPNNVIPPPLPAPTPPPPRPVRQDSNGSEKKKAAQDESYRKAAREYCSRARNVEQEQLEKYPHGAPRVVQRKYEAQGLQLPPLGYGSNPGNTKGVIMRAPF